MVHRRDRTDDTKVPAPRAARAPAGVTGRAQAFLDAQRLVGNRAVVTLVARVRAAPGGGAPLVVQRAPPPTQVAWTSITKTDTVPAPPALAGAPTSFTFAHTMEADPLSTDPNGHKGSGPNGKADWWPWFQKRHGLGGLYWVQAHLLNDNLYGPGEPKNLVPFSNTSNTNMETQGERAVKNAVKAGKVVHYKVTAVWDKEPADRRRAWGLIAEGGTLLWGEQFAPTAIVWQAAEKTEQPPGSGNWVDATALSQPSLGWYNTFPDPGHQPAASGQVVPASALAAQVQDSLSPGGDEVVLRGAGFTDGGTIRLEWSRNSLTKPTVVEDVAPAIVGGAFDFRRSSQNIHLLLQVRITDLTTGNWIARIHNPSSGTWS